MSKRYLSLGDSQNVQSTSWEYSKWCSTDNSGITGELSSQSFHLCDVGNCNCVTFQSCISHTHTTLNSNFTQLHNFSISSDKPDHTRSTFRMCSPRFILPTSCLLVLLTEMRQAQFNTMSLKPKWQMLYCIVSMSIVDLYYRKWDCPIPSGGMVSFKKTPHIWCKNS